MLMVTHDLPYALELCPRSVILNGGGSWPTARPATCWPTATMAANRLELPFGFDPSALRSHGPLTG